MSILQLLKKIGGERGGEVKRTCSTLNSLPDASDARSRSDGVSSGRAVGKHGRSLCTIKACYAGHRFVRISNGQHAFVDSRTKTRAVRRPDRPQAKACRRRCVTKDACLVVVLWGWSQRSARSLATALLDLVGSWRRTKAPL